MLISRIGISQAYSSRLISPQNSPSFKAAPIVDNSFISCGRGCQGKTHADFLYLVGVACLGAVPPETLGDDTKEAIVKAALNMAQTTGESFNIGDSNTCAKIVKEDGISNLVLCRGENGSVISKIAFSSFTCKPFNYSEFDQNGALVRKTGFTEDGIHVSFVQKYVDGKIVEKTKYDSDGDVDFVIDYKNDAVSEKRAYKKSANDVVDFVIKYENGLAVSSTGYKKDGKTEDYFVQFDKDGTPTMAAGYKKNNCHLDWMAGDFGNSPEGVKFNKIESFNMAGKKLPEVPADVIKKITRWVRVFND